MKKNKCLLIIVMALTLLPQLKNKACIKYDGLFTLSKNEYQKKRQISTINEIFLDEIEAIGGINYGIEYTVIVTDFNGNEFAVCKYNPAGFAILNIGNGTIMEISTNSNFNFNKNELIGSYYVPLEGFYKIINNEMIKLGDNYVVNTSDIKALKSLINKHEKNYYSYTDNKNLYLMKNGINKQTKKNTFIDISHSGNDENRVDAPRALYEVPFSWYFRNNFTSFPKNKSGTCGYTAASLLLMYNEVYFTPGFFTPLEREKYIKTALGPFGSKVPELKDNFVDEVWPNAGSSEPAGIKREIDDFLDGKNLNYDAVRYYAFFGKNVIDLVKEGYPVAYFGNLPKNDENVNDGDLANHAIVVYGVYSDERLLTHYGHDNFSQVIIHRGTVFQEGGRVWIENYGAHKHHGYFMDTNLVKIYCGCGAILKC